MCVTHSTNCLNFNRTPLLNNLNLDTDLDRDLDRDLDLDFDLDFDLDRDLDLDLDCVPDKNENLNCCKKLSTNA